jgi:hypothetical protein
MQAVVRDLRCIQTFDLEESETPAFKTKRVLAVSHHK